MSTATTTTYIPNRLYNITGSTTEKYIYANGNLIGTVSNIAATSSNTTYRYWNHSDHLGGSNVTTGNDGIAVETITYQPFGSILEDTKTSSFEQSRKYLGEETENMGSMAYLNARYYEGSRGQFLSQDPVHLAIGNAGQVKQLSGQDMLRYLSDPQQLNSYSYARNNPIVNKDPTGNATYIGNNGAGMTGIDTWNTNTYYESGDQALLSANASYGEANRYNAVSFYNQVKPGGPWDYKTVDSRGFYFFNGKLVSAEDFGNLNYGYAGTAYGLGKDILTDAAGSVQVATAGRTNRGATLTNISGNFDDPRDTARIRTGVSAYNNSGRSNSSTGYAAASNAAYNGSGARDVARILSAVAAVAKAFLKNK